MPSRSFSDLEVWQRAHALRLDVYALTRGFPQDERWRLADQMVRAASSIPSNIAEGFRRYWPKEKAHFYRIADASAAELLDAFYVCRDLKYVPDIRPFVERIDVLQRMLCRLIQTTLGQRPPARRPAEGRLPRRAHVRGEWSKPRPVRTSGASPLARRV